MFCTRCGVLLRDDDRYCSQCGNATELAGERHASRPLMLDKRNRKIAGVCAGFARYLDVDVTLVRVISLALAISTGVGFMAYIAAWMVIPSDRGVPVPVGVTPVPQAF